MVVELDAPTIGTCENRCKYRSEGLKISRALRNRNKSHVSGVDVVSFAKVTPYRDTRSTQKP